VTAILIRWKYCFDWPGALKELENAEDFIPAHVNGLYVRVKDGELRDLRPSVLGNTPSMSSLLSLKASELQAMLITGLKKQLELVQSKSDKNLRDYLLNELKKAEKLKVKKIERKYQEALAAKKGSSGAPTTSAAAAKEEDDDDE
jgi:hypothetical protein